MALGDYIAALKRGRRRYQDALAKGEYPYLSVLDDILAYTEIVSTVSLGDMDIPLSKVVGTKSAERTNAFANNFMPLLSEKSEFAGKWAALYDYQVREGIQDPIVVYEYMNQFYVQEGNKRVSVMKYLGAYSITGRVTRLIPRKTDELENRLYYEFLDFYQVSQNCDVWFSREGGYRKLLQLMGCEEDHVWDSEERLFFRSAYGRFEKAFHMARGERLEMTPADAFLTYVEIYGYDQVKAQTEREMYQALMRIWREIQLTEGGRQVELVQDARAVEEYRRPSLLSRLIPPSLTGPEVLKIGFIHVKTGKTSSWTYAHELGRLHLEQVFGKKVQTLAIEHANTDPEVENAIELAIASGCTLIFTTAPQMINQSVRSAILHPDVKIYNCSIRMSYSSICTYYGRMYESKMLLGAIAAAMSGEDKLGYIADYPIYGTMANINAFALGARMINPRVTVHLEWSRTREGNPAERLREKGISYISGDDMITPEHMSREYGLYVKHEDGRVENLATPIWHWGKFYERIVGLAASGGGEVHAEVNARKGSRAVNYWWGISAGVIDVICSDSLPDGVKRLIDFLKSSIRTGTFRPFDGPIRAQSGELMCPEGGTLKPDEIITMNWLAESVIGRIPEPEELTEDAQALLMLQGVKVDENGDTEE